MNSMCIALTILLSLLSSSTPEVQIVKYEPPGECLHMDYLPNVPHYPEPADPLPLRHVECDVWKIEFVDVNRCEPGRKRCITRYMSGTFLKWTEHGGKYPSQPYFFENVYVTARNVTNSTVALKDLNEEGTYGDYIFCHQKRVVNITAEDICYREVVIPKRASTALSLLQLQATCGDITIKTSVYEMEHKGCYPELEYACDKIELKWEVRKWCYQRECRTTLYNTAFLSTIQIEKFSPDVVVVVNGTKHDLKTFKAELIGPPRNDADSKYVHKYIIQTDLESPPYDYVAYNNASAFNIETITARCNFVVWHTTITREVVMG